MAKFQPVWSIGRVNVCGLQLQFIVFVFKVRCDNVDDLDRTSKQWSDVKGEIDIDRWIDREERKRALKQQKQQQK